MAEAEPSAPPRTTAIPAAIPTTIGPRGGYVHDEPWRPGEAERLGRRGFAQRIARTVAARQDPAGLVLALYGAWGDGKTSVLRMVKEDLAATPDVVVIDFNPWRFRDADHLVEMFFNTLAERLGAAVTLRTSGEAVGDALRRYGRVLKGIPLVGDAAGEAAEAVGARIGEPSLETIRERVEEGIRAAGVRPVIFIDDVDRLDGAEIRAVVRLVKLTAGFERTTYVLAFDPDVVAAALAAAVGGAAPSDGRRYLEKIVQVPLQLPAADQDTLFDLTMEHLADALRDVDAPFPDGEQQAFVRYVQPLFRARPRTVREGKRYANAAGFALPLLAGEVNVGDLLLLEAVRAWYPEVHARVQAHRDLFVGDALGRPPLGRDGSMSRPAAESAWAEVVAGVDAREARPVREALEHLFPFVQAVTKKVHHGSEWTATWDRTQRAASRNYFDRYFQYAVPRGDVSDALVERVEAALGAGDVPAAAVLIEAGAARGAAERLVDKLSARVPALTPAAATALARTLASTGAAYPATESGLLGSWGSPAAAAGRVVNQCLRRVPAGERVALALEVVTTTPSLRFAAACYQWLRALGTQREEGTATVSAEEEERVRVALGARLDAEHQAAPLYRREPAADRRALLTWWGIGTSIERTRVDLAGRFVADPGEAVAFLLPFRSHGWMVESGLPTPDRLDRNDYEAAARLADPQVVMDALRRAFGDDIGAYDEYSPPTFGSVEEATAHQFARCHRLAQALAPPPEPDQAAADQDDAASQAAESSEG